MNVVWILITAMGFGAVVSVVATTMTVIRGAKALEAKITLPSGKLTPSESTEPRNERVAGRSPAAWLPSEDVRFLRSSEDLPTLVRELEVGIKGWMVGPVQPLPPMVLPLEFESQSLTEKMNQAFEGVSHWAAADAPYLMQTSTFVRDHFAGDVDAIKYYELPDAAFVTSPDPASLQGGAPGILFHADTKVRSELRDLGDDRRITVNK